MQAVILAGGLGTRLRPITDNIPKAMVPVLGKPFLEYQIRMLKEKGIDDFVISIGYLGNKIVKYFGDGSALGVKIRYSNDGKRLLGPAGARKNAEPSLEDAFFATYGDAYLILDYKSLMSYLLSSGKLGVIAVYRNENRYGKSDIDVRQGYVVKYSKSGKESFSWINFGVVALRKASLRFLTKGAGCSKEEFYGKLIAIRQLLAYEVNQRFYEIGTPNSLREFEALLSAGEIQV